jgi:hypothetical protein
MATAMQPAGLMAAGTKASDNAEVGKAQREFAQRANLRAQELIESGQCDPFTIVNFNPVDLGLQGLFKRYKVPSPNDPRLPKDVMRVTLPYDGREVVGHVMTIRAPLIDGKMTGAQLYGGPGEVIAQREPVAYTPMAIVFTFLEHFTPIFWAQPGSILPPSPKDGRKIFGVLGFKGDIQTLERLLDEDDPARQVIQIPVAHIRAVGGASLKSYRLVNYNLQTYLARMFEGQKRFADATISRAQQKWSEEAGIRDISDSDRVWYRWAINMGFALAPKAGEKTWLNELVTLTGGASEQGSPDSRLRKCQACRTVEPEMNTPFCPKCAAPINTFETFMAGYPVADAWLMALKGEDREVALAELRIRRQGFEGEPSAVGPSPSGVAAAQRGPYKGKAVGGRGKAGAAAIEPGADIPDAETVNLPGEE